MVRLVVLDMDGTLLDGHERVAPETARLIRAAVARGVHFVLASARSPCSVLPFHRGLGLDTPMCCFNGALVRAGLEETWLAEPLPVETAARLADWCRERGLYAKVFGDDLFFVSRATEETVRYSAGYLVPFAEVGDLPGFIRKVGLEPFAFVVHAEPGLVRQLEQEVRALFAGAVSCHVPNDHALHLSSHRASKLAAVRLVAERLGVPPGECLAVGDGENDVEMISWAGVGAAVGNASPRLAAVADYVAAQRESAGVAEVLSRFLAPPEGLGVGTAGARVEGTAPAAARGSRR